MIALKSTIHRIPMKLLKVAFLILTALASGASLLDAADRPNVVLIYVDDLGYGDLSCYGSEQIFTPQIDQLADQGMRFTDAYVTSPVCGPSRVGLLTGAYPQRFGVYYNPDTTRAAIPESYRILPELMRDAGYATGIIGKWNITRDPYASADYVKDPMIWGGNYWPDESGIYAGVGGGWGDNKIQGVWGPERPGDEYLTDRLTQHAVNFIEANAGKPFFLYLAYNAPHSPLQAEKSYADRVAHIESEPLKLYAAMVMAMDEGVGRVREALAKAGVEGNTLVIFMSDNGPAKGGFKGYKEDWPRQLMGSTGGLRGQKGTHFEGGIRVPLIMKWPAVIKSGTTGREPVITLDFLPTLAALAGVRELGNPHVDGRNLLPYLQHGEYEPRPLFWARENEGALRLGEWKYYYTKKDGPELYNLAGDMEESDDLAKAEAERLASLTKLHDAWLAEMPPHTDRSKPTIIQPQPEKPLQPVLP